MSYIPGMNQNWSGGTSTPANPSAVQNPAQRSTKDALNPLTGMPYTGAMSENTGGQYGGHGEVGPAMHSNAAANQWLNAQGAPSEGVGDTGMPGFGTPYSNKSMKASGAQPGGAMGMLGFDDGGAVPDPTATPDPNGAGSSDATPDPSSQGAIPDPGDAIPAPQGDQAQPNINDMLNSAIDTYQYGLQKYGMGDQQGNQQQAMMPSKPAGPGGDQPNTNPFPIKNPSPPFGKLAYMPAIPAGPGGDQPNPNPFPTKTPNPPFGQRFSAADQRPIPPAPNGPPIKPFDPRDYLPGGSKASQGAIPTQVG